MSKTKSLTADQIMRAADTTALVPVEVPEWGGRVYVGVMTAGEKDAYEKINYDEGRKGSRRRVRARFAALVCRDENGNRLFPDPLAEGTLAVNQLCEKSAVALDRIWEAGQSLNFLDLDAQRALAKNSAATTDSSSS